MASGTQVSEEARGEGGVFEVDSLKQVLDTETGGVCGGEIGAAAGSKVAEEPGGVGGGEIGVATLSKVAEVKGEVGGEYGVEPANQPNGEAERAGDEIGEASADQVTDEAGGLVGEIEVPSANEVAREAEGVGGEVGVVSSNHLAGEPVSSGGEVGVAAANQVTGELLGAHGEIEVASSNHVAEKGDVGGEIGVYSSCQVAVETGGLSCKIGMASSSEVAVETEGLGGKIELAFPNQVDKETGGLGDKLGVAPSGQVAEETGGIGGEVGVSSSSQVAMETGGLGGKIGMVYSNQVAEEIGGVGCKLGLAPSSQVAEESGGLGGEVEMASSCEVAKETGGVGDDRVVASVIKISIEPGDIAGENGVASAHNATGEECTSVCEDELPFLSKGDGEPGSRVDEIEMDLANPLNGKVVCGGGEIGVASKVNGEPGGMVSESRVASSNQLNGVAGRVGSELGVGEKHKWAGSKVYRRRPKGEKNKGVLSDLTVTVTAAIVMDNGNMRENTQTSEVNIHESNHNHIDEVNHNNNKVEENRVAESEKVVSVPSSGYNADLNQMQPENTGQMISNNDLTSAGMDSVPHFPVDPPVTNGALRPPYSVNDGKVKINMSSATKTELRELKRKFESELYSVRKAVKKMDGGREEVVHEFFHPVVNSSVMLNGARSNGFASRVYSGTRSLGHVPYKPNIRPFNQLRVSVVENGHGMVDSIEREKRTPKANQFYRNSEFLLANDKFPPAESNKKSKSNGKKSSGGEFGFGVGSKVYKSCSVLLEKLMKHKHGWVFNAPVDVKGLGLHDYFLIIKNPMDLGTVKAKLIKYWYKSPMEFAEDVRLTFHNAMMYNPKGHDVHIMAETLLKIFEGKWPDIEVKYLKELRMAVEPDMGYPTPTSRITNPFQSQPLPPLETRVYNRSESMPQPVNPKPRTLTHAPSFRAPALKKPKAKDVNKRDMTYDEKQKLSTNLQSLPPEKLDGVIQIIKKRSTALSQNDDEIEVDIDSVDTETLWELDRFVSNYKKSLSKYRRKAELANQMRAEARQAAEKITTPQPMPPKESTAGYGNASLSLPPRQNDAAANPSGSSSSSSSSSSGSSSSDSDSDSSSEESDGGRSPGT